MNYIQEAVDWFVTIKAPDLKEKVMIGMRLIENKEPLEANYKKLFGFIIFDYSMHKGPLSFIASEIAAEEIGVTEEVKYYANDWIKYNPSNQK